MTEWFNERYISRSEHKQVVAYYEKLVAQLYRKMLELRAQTGGLADRRPDLEPEGQQVPPYERAGGMDICPAATNVISVDFRRRASVD
jgi:hypothetical protein